MRAKFSLASALLLFLPFESALGDAYTVNLAPGWNAIANQSARSANTLDGVGLPAPDGSTLLFWETASSSFTSFHYFEGFGWVDQNFNPAGATPFPPGVGALFFNPTDANLSWTIVAEPNIPTLPLAVPANALALVARQTNAVGTYENILGRQPGEGARVYKLIAGCGGDNAPVVDSTNCYTEYVFTGGAWMPQVPMAQIGEAVWVVRVDGDDTNAVPPSITMQPQNRTVFQGSSGTFTVVASGTPPLLYQWRFNDADIPGANNPTHTVTNAQPSNAGNYSVIIANSAGSVTSFVATLTVNPLPPGAGFCTDFDFGLPDQMTLYGSAVIEDAGGPGSGGVARKDGGGVVKLTDFPGQIGSLVLADLNGGNPVAGFTATFKAFVGGAPMPGAEGFSFNFAADLPGAPFDEECAGTGLIVSFDSFNNGGEIAPGIEVKWNGAVVAQQFVAISQGPLAINFVDVRIHVAPDGALDVDYNGVPIFQSFPTPWLPIAGRFGLGARTSAAFWDNHWIDDLCIDVADIAVAPRVTLPPQSLAVKQGSNAMFAVTVVGTAPLSYQWRFNGADISGASNSTHTVSNAQPANAGNYSVIVSNSAGSVTSIVAALTVNLPPAITVQPQSRTNNIAPANATFTVTASGTAPLAYQWFRDGVKLDGEVMPALNVNGVMLPQAPAYTVVVSNVCGAVTSAPAFFILRPPDPRFVVVNVIPWEFSSERAQNAEPDIAVHPNNAYRTQISSYQQTSTAAQNFFNPDIVVENGFHPYFITPGNLDPPLPEFPDRYWKLLNYGTAVSHFGSASDWASSGRLYVALRLDPDPAGPAVYYLSVGYKGLTNIAGMTNQILTQFTNFPASRYTNRMDPPWIRVATVAGPDRIYAGFNDRGDVNGANARGATVRFSLDSGRTWENEHIDRQFGIPGDGRAVRIAVNGDVVYAAFVRIIASGGLHDPRCQIIVVRDDFGAGFFVPFSDLGPDGEGVNVTATFPEGAAQEITIPVSSLNVAQDPPTIASGTSLGHQPLGSDLSLAVDPKNAARVFIAYAEVLASGNTFVPQVHVARSVDSGVTWQRVFTAETNSALPALAIATNGTVGLLYTRLREGRLETRLLQTTANFARVDVDAVLATFPDNTPFPTFDNYIGMRQELESVGEFFHGAFSASNDPDPANFPRGVLYQRNVEMNGRFRMGVPLIIAVTNKGRLVNTAGFFLTSNAYTPQGISIDPFHVRVRAVKPVDPAKPVVPMIASNPDAGAVIPFGNICRGSRSEKKIRITNKGLAALTITSIARLPGGSPTIFPSNMPALPYTLLPDEAFTFYVQCVPRDFGAVAATIRITSNDPAQPNLDLMFTATTTPPQIDVALPIPRPPPPGPLAFDDRVVGAFHDLKLTITDISGGTCKSRVRVRSNSPEFVILPFVNRLGANDPIQVTVRFRPLTPGRKLGMVTVTGANPGQAPIVVNVTGDSPVPPAPAAPFLPLQLVQARGLAEYGIVPLGPPNLFPGPIWGVAPFLGSRQVLACPGFGFRTAGFGRDVWRAAFPIAPLPGFTQFAPPLLPAPFAVPFGAASTRMWANPAGGIVWGIPTFVVDVPGDATASFNASRGFAWYLNPNPPGSPPLVTTIGAAFAVNGFVPFGGEGGIGLRVNFNGLFPVQDAVPPVVIGIAAPVGLPPFSVPPGAVAFAPDPLGRGFFFTTAIVNAAPIALGPGLFLLDSTLTLLADPGMEFYFDDTLIAPEDLPGIGAFIAPSNTIPASVPEILSLNVQLAGTNAVVSWPAPAEGFVLEAAPHLVPPIPWRQLAEPPTVVDLRHTLTLPTAADNRFFRLRRAENPLVPFRTDFINGDYTSAGVGLRGTGAGGIASGSLTISNVPANAEVVAAYLYWATMGNGEQGTFNGSPITGTPLGTNAVACDTLPEIVVYRADVLNLLPQNGGAIEGNGTFTVQLPDSGNFAVAPSSAGASLVIIYQHASLPPKFISIHESAHTLNRTVEALQLRLEGFVSGANPQAKLTHIVANGAAARNDRLTFNGASQGNPTDAFTGAQGPRWDNATFDVSALVHPYDSLAATSAELVGGSPDCLTWGAVVFSVTVVSNAQEIPSGANLTVTALAGDNGTINPNGLLEVPAGASQLLVATPAANYEVDTWYLDGVPAQTGGAAFTLTDIQMDHIVGVSFKVVSTAVDLSVQAELSPQFAIAGEEAVVSLVVSNAGPGTAQNVTLTNMFPAGATVVSAITSQGSCANLGEMVLCDLGAVAAGVSATITLTLTLTNEGSFTLTANAISTSAELAPDDNTTSAEIEVLTSPVILAQPESEEADEGNTVVLGVMASGSEPLGYQWYFNGQALAGETSSTLVLTNIMTLQEGTYYVIVSNEAGEVSSEIVTLMVSPAVP